MSEPRRKQRQAGDMPGRVIPFDRWCELYKPSEHDKAMYWKVVNGLREIAEHGEQTEFVSAIAKVVKNSHVARR